jgi:DNA-binding winged helix-turn-helix (wHTH) protein/TolB-like protein/Flp pilus assembly protein TadD
LPHHIAARLASPISAVLTSGYAALFAVKLCFTDKNTLICGYAAALAAVNRRHSRKDSLAAFRKSRAFPQIERQCRDKTMNGEQQQNISFAEFELDTAHRRLLRQGKPLSLYAKTFDLLAFLLEHNGQVVTKDEILETVWEGQFVEEANLSVQVSALRKVLGEKIDAPRFLVTVPGKGYKFVANIQNSDDQNEIVIQKQTVTRLVVESESEYADENSPPIAAIYAATNDVAINPLQLPARSLPRNNTRYAIFAASGLLFALLALLAYNKWSQQPVQPTAQIKSIAVLPFKPLVSENRNESLEIGMADTLIAKLSNFREINVRPISAVRRYADIEQDAVAAGREQKVDAVLDGQIQKSDEKIRMTVRLVRVEDGMTIWTNQFDEKMTDIFTVQDSISERVAGALALQLTREEKGQLTKRYTENTEAYQLYLMGRYHLNRLTDDGFLKGRDYFQQAIDKDPNYALAYAGLADAYNRLSNFNSVAANEGFPKAKTAAMKSLELDGELAEAHTALGTVKHLYDWDWPNAEMEFKRAIEINPSYSDGHETYAYYLSSTGRFDEALAEIRHAQGLDPLSLSKITGEGEILRYARRYDEAIEQNHKALEMDPNSGFVHWTLGNAYVNKGMYEEAIAEYQKAIPLSGDSPDEPASLAYAYALSGRSREALKIVDDLNERSKRSYISPTVMAFIYAGLGEKDQAFALLDKAYDGRDFLLVLLKTEPMFDPLRSDPRFTELMRRVGLPK